MNVHLLQSYTPCENAEKPRNYYLPFSTFNDSLDKSKSDRVTLLTKWKFAYYPFYEEGIEHTEPAGEIDVPSNIQKKGYDKEIYINSQYPIPYNPPFVDKDNPCCVYQTEYFVGEKTEKYYAVFDGVDNAYFFYVNGEYVGYATGSHAYHEFDLTDFLQVGANLLTVVVFKYSAATYLECQDKIRMTGIFREAYILRRPHGHLREYSVTTDYEGREGKIRLHADKEVSCTLYDGKRKIAFRQGSDLTFTLPNVKLWSAEIPHLYRLEIERLGEHIVDYAGVRKIKIEGKTFTLNGKKIKIRGVNRHSFTVNGYVESIADIEKDLKLLKAHNVNGIRTSHYMPHSALPLLCDKYGIYLMEECDIETHGDVYTQGKYVHKDGWRISNDENFYPMYRHRMENMYYRDQNRPSILFWSMGNEAGWGENFVKCYRLLKELDSERPVHYEGMARYVFGSLNLDVKETDVYSTMYSSPEECVKILESEELDRPFILCEYTHAMGNSCGDIAEYAALFDRYESFIGGFVWEYCNEVIFDGKKQLFGGDVGENFHSGGFCVDGLVSTDRKTLYSSFKEMKEVYAPVRLDYEEGALRVTNKGYFRTLSARLDWRVENAGELVQKGSISLAVPPEQTEEEALQIAVDKEGYTTLTCTVSVGKREICRRQFVFSDTMRFSLDRKSDGVKIERAPALTWRVACGETQYVVGRKGTFTSIVKGGKEYLAAPVELKVLRPQTDNDIEYNRPLLEGFTLFQYLSKAELHVREGRCEGNRLFLTGTYSVDALEWRLDLALTYTFYEDGGVRLQIDARQHEGGLGFVMTRFGLEIPLKEEYATLEYFGSGEEECYADKKHLAVVGKYSARVKDAYVPYVRPQASGNHTKTRYVNMQGNLPFGVCAESDFNFSVMPIKSADYKRHAHEMPPVKSPVLNVDYFMAGVGSNSCGPRLADEYRLTDERFTFTVDFRLREIKNQ